MRSALAVLLVAACSSHPSGHTPGTPDANVGSDSAGSPDASPTSAEDPANDGTTTYTSATVSITVGSKTVPATVYTPSSAGMHALVVISPGFQMARTQYASYAKHLASWNFEVVLADYADTSFFPDHAAMAADIKSVVDWAVAQPGVDATRVALAGHSLGGKLSTFAASLDARVKAVVGWDPVDSSNPSVVPEKMSTIHAAVAVIGETTDGSGGGMPCAPTAESFQAFYTAAPSPAYALTVAGADHMDWVDDPSCALCGFCSPGSAAPEVSRTATRRVNVAWLRRVLFDDTSMDAWLDTPPGAGLTVQRR